MPLSRFPDVPETTPLSDGVVVQAWHTFYGLFAVTLGLLGISVLAWNPHRHHWDGWPLIALLAGLGMMLVTLGQLGSAVVLKRRWRTLEAETAQEYWALMVRAAHPTPHELGQWLSELGVHHPKGRAVAQVLREDHPGWILDSAATPPGASSPDARA